MDYKNKIRKLLSLSQSPNENEAKLALLKARELMAEHKLTERECVTPVVREIQAVETEYYSNSRREPWLIRLSMMIGDHYCCKAYTTRVKKQANAHDLLLWF